MRIILFFLISSSFLSMAQVGTPQFRDYNSREKFGNYLFNTEDYIRANDEFNYLLSQGYKIESNLLKSAICYRKLRKFDSTLTQLSKLQDSVTGDVQKAITFLESGKSDQALYIFSGRNFPPSSDIGRMKLLTDYYYSNSLPNLQLAFQGDTLTRLQSLFTAKLAPPKYDKNIATLLSVFLPGSGKVYLDQYTEGIASLLAISLFSYLSVHSFNHENRVQGVVFTTLTSLFYVGNVYGTYSEAMRLNILEKIDNRVEYEKYIKEKNYFLEKKEDGVK